jgi:hypothetical protein
MSIVNVQLTEQEANALMQVLATAPMPYTVSQPLINRLGQAMAMYQQQQVGQAAGAGSLMQQVPRPLTDDDFEKPEHHN